MPCHAFAEPIREPPLRQCYALGAMSLCNFSLPSPGRPRLYAHSGSRRREIRAARSGSTTAIVINVPGRASPVVTALVPTPRLHRHVPSARWRQSHPCVLPAPSSRRRRPAHRPHASPSPPPSRRIVARSKLAGVLARPGGPPNELDYRTGGPPRPSHLYNEEPLRDAFAAMTIEALQSYEADVSEGTGHRGRSALIGLVARRGGRAPAGARRARPGHPRRWRVPQRPPTISAMGTSTRRPCLRP